MFLGVFHRRSLRFPWAIFLYQRVIQPSLVFVLASAACSPPANPPPVEAHRATALPVIATPTVAPTLIVKQSASTATAGIPAATATENPGPTWTPTPVATETPISEATPSPTHTPTATPYPTYAILRGKVLELANCRYGPGAPYLYKYALIPGSNLEIIGRNDLGTWILVRAIGGNNPCWVKASLMEIKGEVMSVAPTYIPLPQSPYYGPPTGVSAARNGDEVTVSWYGIKLKAGDDSEQFPYLIEAWVCQNGQIVFTPVGSYANAAKITDEPGCSEPSHGRLYGVEKHGYTQWVEIPWPPRSG